MSQQLDPGGIATELGAFGLVFVHAGSLFDPASFQASLIANLRERGYSVGLAEVADVSGSCDSDVTLLTGFDVLAERGDRCEKLANARAWAMQQLANRHRVVALSRVPKARLLGCPGSQLILDARTAFPPRIADDDVRVALLGAGAQPKQADYAVRVCRGLPRLVAAMTDAVNTGSSPREAQTLAQTSLTAELRAAINELGPELAVLLDEALFERDDACVDPEQADALLLEGLRGAGLVDWSTTTQQQPMSLLAAGRDGALTSAVRDAVDARVRPPEGMPALVAGLWEIERTLRRRVQLCAVERNGNNWRDAVLSDPDLERRVRERVSSERAAIAPKLIGNPLEWLTLDELMTLVEAHEWARPPEVPLVFFRRLRTELQPVRNRAAHFRLPQPRDPDVVRKWVFEIRRRLRVE